MTKVPLTVRIEGIEMERLKEFCQQTGRTQTDVVRELLRKLKLKPSFRTGLVSQFLGQGR